ncbi:hypothetical protein [Mesorhizobium ventifaucium]|uniref:Transcriptional regulator n=1 Tax=Mesorhizobium ventifaucium TaxID=666020 RepID=A0ABM9DRD6_9HYPH|nr:hypothetical protein [Mesorhizobium ventifaucium]CAH2399232.1 hypothetical protein MES4922_210162 [Mesorhizobium ventifaucium]
MMALVLKAFPTRLRRFKEGDRVSPQDDLSPQGFDRLVETGYIEKLPYAAKLKKQDPSKAD